VIGLWGLGRFNSTHGGLADRPATDEPGCLPAPIKDAPRGTGRVAPTSWAPRTNGSMAEPGATNDRVDPTVRYVVHDADVRATVQLGMS
jgi:hypothetical protein